MKMNPTTRFNQPAPRLFGGVFQVFKFAGLTLILSAGLGGFLRAAESAALPAATTVQTNVVCTRVITEIEVVTLLTAVLQRDYVKERGDLELRFTQPWVAPTLPDESLTMKISELPTAGVTPAFIVRFQLCTAERTLGTWQANVQAHVWREVWVAHSTLRRGAPLNSADVVHERYDVLKVREALADFSMDDADLELAEQVSSGAPLLARMIKPRVVIRRGQLTNARLQDGALTITTKVEALEDGAPGQTIRARNPVSRRDVRGQVVDGQTLLISL
jgi:flagella basal body P-ring formation protein FlgA